MQNAEEIVHRIATYIAKRIFRDKTLTACLGCGTDLKCRSCDYDPLPISNVAMFSDARETRLTELIRSEMEEGVSSLIEAAIEERIAEVKHAIAIRDDQPSIERAALQATYMLAIKKRRDAVDALVISPGH